MRKQHSTSRLQTIRLENHGSVRPSVSALPSAYRPVVILRQLVAQAIHDKTLTQEEGAAAVQWMDCYGH